MTLSDPARVQVNCPNCGAALDWRFALSKMRDCIYCGTTVLRDGEQLRQLGESGEMLDASCLLRLGAITQLGARQWRPIGHLRFSYGPGWWDEFWCISDDGKASWISVDEGDIVCEVEIEPPHSAPARLTVGVSISFGMETFTAVEDEQAVCVAIRGELPEAISVGETHRYVDFTGSDGSALTFESWRSEDGASRTAWHHGVWSDPWDATLIEASG